MGDGCGLEVVDWWKAVKSIVCSHNKSTLLLQAHPAKAALSWTGIRDLAKSKLGPQLLVEDHFSPAEPSSPDNTIFLRCNSRNCICFI